MNLNLRLDTKIAQQKQLYCYFLINQSLKIVQYFRIKYLFMFAIKPQFIIIVSTILQSIT
jgi:hypothetical protein